MSIKFWKHSAFMAVVEVISKFKGLVIMPLLTQQFSTADYGIWNQTLGIALTFTPIILLGMDQSLVRFYSGADQREQRAAFSTLILFSLCTIAIVGSSVIILEGFIIQVFFAEQLEIYANLVMYAVVFMLLNVLNNMFVIWLQIQGKFYWYGAMTVIQSFLGILVVSLLLFTDGDVFDLCLFTICADAAIFLGLFLAYSFDTGWLKPNIRLLPELLRYGVPLIPSGYAFWGLNWADRIFIAQYETISDVGIYSLLYGVGALVIPLLSRPFWVTFPAQASRLFNQEKKIELQTFFNKSAGSMFLLFVPAIAGLNLVSKDLIFILATEEYVVHASLMVWISGGYAMNMLAGFFEWSLGLSRRPFWITISMVTALVSNVALNFMLVPDFGIHGAAWATSIAFFIQFLVSYIASKKTKVFEINFTFVFKVIIASIFMYLVGVYFKYHVDNYDFLPWINLMSVAMVGVIVYVLTLLLILPSMRNRILTSIKSRKLV